MKQKRPEPELSVEQKREEWEMTLEGECVLRCALTWPELAGTWKGVEAVNRYYRRAAQVWRRRWERELYCRACLDLADRRVQGRPFRVWQAELVTCITLQEGALLSLWQEGREHWGYDRPLFLRRGDTWSLTVGAPRTLGSFYPKKRRWKRQVLAQGEEQMRARLEGGESLLDPDCVQRLRRVFDPENYYLTGEGVQVFFPMYTMASGVEGIPAFSVALPER